MRRCRHRPPRPPARYPPFVHPTAAELMQIIADLVARKWAPGASAAEVRLCDRMLNGLRNNYECAGPIWESLDDSWAWSVA